jgi:hypothetical protein
MARRSPTGCWHGSNWFRGFHSAGPRRGREIVAAWSLEQIEINSGFLPSLSLALPRGLTCVIGPCGSGKSTLAEAIRYALANARVLSKTTNDLIEKNIINAVVSIKTAPGDTGGDGAAYLIRRTGRQAPSLCNLKGALHGTGQRGSRSSYAQRGALRRCAYRPHGKSRSSKVGFSSCPRSLLGTAVPRFSWPFSVTAWLRKLPRKSLSPTPPQRARPKPFAGSSCRRVNPFGPSTQQPPSPCGRSGPAA